jgi:hypothetical protein
MRDQVVRRPEAGSPSRHMGPNPDPAPTNDLAREQLADPLTRARGPAGSPRAACVSYRAPSRRRYIQRGHTDSQLVRLAIAAKVTVEHEMVKFECVSDQMVKFDEMVRQRRSSVLRGNKKVYLTSEGLFREKLRCHREIRRRRPPHLRMTVVVNGGRR